MEKLVQLAASPFSERKRSAIERRKIPEVSVRWCLKTTSYYLCLRMIFDQSYFKQLQLKAVLAAWPICTVFIVIMSWYVSHEELSCGIIYNTVIFISGSLIMVLNLILNKPIHFFQSLHLTGLIQKFRFKVVSIHRGEVLKQKGKPLHFQWNSAKKKWVCRLYKWTYLSFI